MVLTLYVHTNYMISTDPWHQKYVPWSSSHPKKCNGGYETRHMIWH